MSTSGTYTFTVTRDDIIREAMLNTGKLGSTGYLSPQETLDCARKLNMLVKQWMGRQGYAPGLKMWTRARGDLFLSSSQYQYALGPTGDQWAGSISVAQPNSTTYAQNPLTVKNNGGSAVLTVGTTNVLDFTVGDFVVVELDSNDIFTSTVLSRNTGAGTVTLNANLPSAASATNYVWNYTTKAQRPLEIASCVLRDINNNDTPMDMMTLQTYEALPTKTSGDYLSDPTAIYYEPDLTNGLLTIDCGGAQDVTKRLHMVYLRPVQDFNNPLDNPDYPAEWFLALAWGLTKQIAPMFNAIFTKAMADNLDESLAIARFTNPETTEVYFRPNADQP